MRQPRLSLFTASIFSAVLCAGALALAAPASAEDAAKSVVQSATTPAAKKVKAKRAPPSACVGLDETACAGKAGCYWRKATLLKSGKTRRAHCRKKSSRAKAAAPAT
jgi:hypothetical protein